MPGCRSTHLGRQTGARNQEETNVVHCGEAATGAARVDIFPLEERRTGGAMENGKGWVTGSGPSPTILKSYGSEVVLREVSR